MVALKQETRFFVDGSASLILCRVSMVLLTLGPGVRGFTCSGALGGRLEVGSGMPSVSRKLIARRRLAEAHSLPFQVMRWERKLLCFTMDWMYT